MKRNIYDRHVLYAQVWERPMSAVSKDYGISDVALKKICRRLDVPTPYRGYWAKVAAGQSLRIPPLPKPDREERIEGWGMDEKERSSSDTPTEDPLLRLEESDRDYIELVARGIEYNQRVRLRPMLKEVKDTGGCPGEVRRVNNPSSYSLNEWVSGSQIPRVVAIMETLGRAAEKMGGSLVKPLRLSLLGEKVDIEIKEVATKVEHVITSQEQKELDDYERERKMIRWASKPRVRKWDYRFEGDLTLCVRGLSFADTDVLRLEDCLPDVFMELCRAALSVRTKREEVEQRVREHKSAIEQAQAKVTAYNKESGRLRIAIEEAHRYELATLLRSYAMSVGERGEEDDEEYMRWLLGKADWLDPLTEAEDAIFGPYEGQELPPAFKRPVSTDLPYEIERFYRERGRLPDESWQKFRHIVDTPVR